MVEIGGIKFRPLHFLQKPRQSDQASQFEQLNRIKVFLQDFSLNSQWSNFFLFYRNFKSSASPFSILRWKLWQDMQVVTSVIGPVLVMLKL